MTDTLLSPNQRAILEAMAEGAALRWAWVDAPHSLGAWRYLLDGKVVDGRAVWGLVLRGLVEWTESQRRLAGNSWGLSDAGRRAVQPDGGER